MQIKMDMLCTYLLLVLNPNKKRSIKDKKRNRYVGFVIVEPNRVFSRRDVMSSICDKARELFVDEAKKFGLKLIRFNGREGIVRCYHIYKDKTIEILNSIMEVRGHKVKIRTIGTSGTIRSLNRKFFSGRMKR